MARFPTANRTALLKLTARDWTGQMLNFHKVTNEVREEIREEFKEIAYGIEISIDKFTPRRTRYLVERLRTRFSESNQAFEVGWWSDDFVREIRNPGGRYYAHFVNFGTRKMRGHHMIEKGFEEGTTDVKPEMLEAINRVINKHRR